MAVAINPRTNAFHDQFYNGNPYYYQQQAGRLELGEAEKWKESEGAKMNEKWEVRKRGKEREGDLFIYSVFHTLTPTFRPTNVLWVSIIEWWALLRHDQFSYYIILHTYSDVLFEQYNCERCCDTINPHLRRITLCENNANELALARERNGSDLITFVSWSNK